MEWKFLSNFYLIAFFVQKSVQMNSILFYPLHLYSYLYNNVTSVYFYWELTVIY